MQYRVFAVTKENQDEMMSKHTHDQYAAASRELCYDKAWFIAAKDAMRDICSPRSVVLDFCCGNGEFSEIVKNEFHSEVICMDYAAFHLDRVRKLGFETIVCDVEDSQSRNHVLDCYTNRFDVVVMLECLEHFFSPDEALTFCSKLLKPEGRLIVTTPNMSSLSFRLYSLFCGNLPVGMGHHTYFFDIRRLKQVLLLNSFNVESVHFFGETGYYLDRAIAYPKSFIKQIQLKLLWKFGRLLGGEDILGGGLLAVAQKHPKAKPIGLDPAIRKNLYAEMEPHEKIETLTMLSDFYRDGMFAEHPGLCKFLENEMATFFSC